MDDPSEIIYYSSPIGTVEVTIREEAIISIYFIEESKTSNQPISDFGETVLLQLKEYFEGNRQTFDLQLKPEGTEFQQQVWSELLKIPFGKTISYIELARRLGDEKKVRAVGNANGNNPISIIIPCHRVIGSNQKLVGYAGGLWRKKFLLDHEMNISLDVRQLDLGF
ncbi:MAG: methylated-DNA--[protein]-cysteine S-methyltransferase [Bacteroidales bacterium]|nr:methylated-DNA--[protein]-cysteine S-methyltransferase [Bacteroidales bacterium]MCF8455204.1 methylated-DNA--[protein]-cysteine S-methyltransferase [Bacteroidales bacterium]